VILDELTGRRVAVWGLGVEGLAVVRLLEARDVHPLLVDDAAASGLPGGPGDSGISGVATVLLPSAVDWGAVDVVVRSPGVSRYRPELRAATAGGTVVTTAMALWLAEHGDLPVLAVTGTKGKSTTATLAASVLAHSGRAVDLVGNIGRPVTDLYDRPPVDAVVVEVSSYQAADVTTTPGVCVLTGLAPDHLDWHGGIEPYYRDKLRLLTAGPPGALAVFAGSHEAVTRTADHPARSLYGPTGMVRVDIAGIVGVHGEPIVDSARLRVPGAHNVANLCGALAGVTLLLGAPPSAGAVARAVDGFEGLPSRCRTVGERDGLTFVDDALASNPTATAASIAAFDGRPLTVILGGSDRGVDPGPVVAALASRRPRPGVVVMPPGAARMAGPLADAQVVPALGADLEEAVDLAVSRTPRGGVVLFSPAAPTPPGDGDYRTRGRRFAAAAGLDGPTIGSGGDGTTGDPAPEEGERP